MREKKLEKQFMIREESLMVQLDEARKTASYYAAENEMLRKKIEELLFDSEIERNGCNDESKSLNCTRDNPTEFFLFIPHKAT